MLPRSLLKPWNIPTAIDNSRSGDFAESSFVKISFASGETVNPSDSRLLGPVPFINPNLSAYDPFQLYFSHHILSMTLSIRKRSKGVGGISAPTGPSPEKVITQGASAA